MHGRVGFIYCKGKGLVVLLDITLLRGGHTYASCCLCIIMHDTFCTLDIIFFAHKKKKRRLRKL